MGFSSTFKQQNTTKPHERDKHHETSKIKNKHFKLLFWPTDIVIKSYNKSQYM